MTDAHPDDPGPAEPGTSTRKLIVTPGSKVTPERLEWWEPGLVLKASINLLAARESKGKSTVASSWAARETRAGGMVLWCGTEESRAHAQVPRLLAAGADMERIIFIDVQTDLGTGALVFPLDLAAFETVIRNHRVTMIVLDPCKGLVPPGFSGNDDIAVRQYLEPIAALVARHNVVLLGLAHFGKRDGADTGKLLLGSVAWSQVARTVLSIAEDPVTGTRVLSNTKSNYTAVDRSVEFRITGIMLPEINVEWGTVGWLGDTTLHARDFLAGDAHEDDDGERTAAENWLKDYLQANGPTRSKVVKSESGKERISERTLQRAKKKLGVLDASMGFPRTSTWYLPGQEDLLDPGGATGGVTKKDGATGATGDEQQKQTGGTGGATGQSDSGATCHETGATVIELCRHCGETLSFDDDRRTGWHSDRTVCVKAQQTHQRATLTVVDGQRPTCREWFSTYIEGLRAQGQTVVAAATVFEAGEAAGYRRAAVSTVATRDPQITVVDRSAGTTMWSITPSSATPYRTLAEFIQAYIDEIPAGATNIDQQHFRTAATEAGYAWDSARVAITASPRVSSVPSKPGSTSLRDRTWRLSPPGQAAGEVESR